MQEIIAQLRNELSGKLTPSRYEHTISVSFTAAALAMRYGCDLDKAELAGLLHDCAKHYSNETIIKKCEKQKITLTEDEKKARNTAPGWPRRNIRYRIWKCFRQSGGTPPGGPI